MSEEKKENLKTGDCKLDGLFAFKLGMSSYYDENGNAQAVTLLKYEPMIVSQLKTKEKDGYEALQVAFCPKKDKLTLKSERKHFKSAGFENGAHFSREIRQTIPEGTAVGATVSLDSLVIGDELKVSSRSKGRGFAGVVKRWGMAGGPAAHGSGFHRRPGSIGNRTWPGRVMPGKKFPGHMGFRNLTVSNLKVLDVVHDESVIIVKGSIPGAQNTLVQLTKV